MMTTFNISSITFILAVVSKKTSYLILPWDGDTSSGKLGVEIIVCLVQIDTFNGGKLLNVQNVFTVDSPGL